ncbi:MAG TPA: DUF4147 domain-containing protein, partial [Rhodocyclaceae bacterium]|nr:DUF4147 domain-containing protein [Rhodocyclaceae bacterium]
MAGAVDSLLIDPATCLRGWFADALNAADPRGFLPSRLPQLLPEWFAPDRPAPRGRLIVVGAGKAAASMAQAVEAALPAGRAVAGLVVTRYGYGLPC